MNWTDTDVLVTGGAGFIGSHLAEELLGRGADVVVADNFSQGGLDRIKGRLNEIELRPVDLTTIEGTLRATECVDHVFPPRRFGQWHPIHPAGEYQQSYPFCVDEPADAPNRLHH